MMAVPWSLIFVAGLDFAAFPVSPPPQVNASPSLTTTTESDRITKLSLLRDIYNIVAAQIPASVSE
jgi:hypothetical protein